MNAADLPAAIVPSASSPRMAADVRVAATMACDGGQASLHQKLQLDQRGQAEISAAGDAAGVGAESKRDARPIQRRDVSQQSLRAVRGVRGSRSRGQSSSISASESVPRSSGSVEPRRPGSVDRVSLAPERLDEEHVRPLAQQREQFLVDVLVANDVAEAVDAGAQQILRVLERGDVRHDADAVLVRFVDDRAIEIRSSASRRSRCDRRPRS